MRGANPTLCWYIWEIIPDATDTTTWWEIPWGRYGGILSMVGCTIPLNQKKFYRLIGGHCNKSFPLWNGSDNLHVTPSFQIYSVRAFLDLILIADGLPNPTSLSSISPSLPSAPHTIFLEVIPSPRPTLIVTSLEHEMKSVVNSSGVI